jgi:hypothetical protein
MTSRGKYKATAKTRAKTEADPYGMTNKKGNSKSNYNGAGGEDNAAGAEVANERKGCACESSPLSQ